MTKPAVNKKDLFCTFSSMTKQKSANGCCQCSCLKVKIATSFADGEILVVDDALKTSFDGCDVSFLISLALKELKFSPSKPILWYCFYFKLGLAVTV